jgi:alginate O-acetyltransferase complex protein AlgI
MSLQSVSYLLFLVLVWAAAMLLRTARSRQVALLAASYLFYWLCGAKFAFLLLGSSLFNYYWGKLLRRKPVGSLLWGGLLVNLAILAGFKYAPPALAFLGSIGALPWQVASSILAPVGVSFFTFQAMSYLLDVYRERDVDPSLPEFLLYIAFWPTILSGPICRAFELIPQFRSESRPSLDDVSAGCHRILLGLFMKVVVADTMARGLQVGEGVNFGFDRVTGGWGAVDVVFLAVGFGFQLFFDFAGYSNIAIGSARLFGFRLRENFDRPYLSRTVSEFWTKWHMSLSFWIRDYLFMPLAMLRTSLAWRNLALVISMTLFGLWHGAASTFVLWGVLQGLFLVAHRQFQKYRGGRGATAWGPGAVRACVSWALTFGAISLGWIMFRANSLGQAWAMYRALFTPSAYRTLALRPNFYVVVILCVAGYFLFEAARVLVRSASRLGAVRRFVWLASPVYYAVLILAVIAWSKQASTFVYLQF